MHFAFVWQNKCNNVTQGAYQAKFRWETACVTHCLKKGGTSLANPCVTLHNSVIAVLLSFCCRNVFLLGSFPFSWTWHLNPKTMFWVRFSSSVRQSPLCLKWEYRKDCSQGLWSQIFNMGQSHQRPNNWYALYQCNSFMKISQLKCIS